MARSLKWVNLISGLIGGFVGLIPILPLQDRWRRCFPRSDSVARSASGYDAFISYSHLEDDALAATLQVGLEGFATPWYRSRALRVFRDTTDLSATPSLLSDIIGALSASRWFVLVASEQAARSRWVNEEVSWWLANKNHDRFLIALSSGRIRWAGEDFDWEYTNALPPALAGAFAEEPGWIDLHEARAALAKGDEARHATRLHRLTRRRARRQVGDWVAGLAAPIRGMAKDNLVGEHLRYRKQTRRTVQTVLAAMMALALAASAAAAVAADQLARARLQARIATSREVAALSESLLSTHLDLAELFAVEAYSLSPGPQALSALFQAVTASPHLVTYLSAGGQVSTVAGSDDGQVIVAGRSDGTVLRWSLPDTRPTVIARMATAVTNVSVDSSGTAVVALSQTTALRWDAVTGAKLLRVPVSQRATGIGISASGRFTALASSTEGTGDRQFDVTLYGPQANKINATSIGNIDCRYITFSGDSQLVTLGTGGAWDRFSVPGLRSPDGPTVMSANESVETLSPGGKLAAYSNGGRDFPIFELKHGSATSPAQFSYIPIQAANPSALAINSPGTLVAQADGGTIYVSGIARNSTSPTSRALPGNSIINNGDLAFAGRNTLVSASGDLLTLWDLGQYSRIATETSITAPSSCAACGGPLVAVSPEGRRVAFITGDGGTMTEQDLLLSGKPAVARSAINSYGLPLWIQDGRQLLVPTADGGAQIWSTTRGLVRSGRWPTHSSAQKNLQDQQEPGTANLPVVVSLRPGGRQVIEVDDEGDILIRNAITGEINEFIKQPPALANYGVYTQNSAAVDAAGQVAALVTPRGIVVTAIMTGRSRMLPGDSADAVAFDGEHLLVQQPDGPLQIWNISAARLIKVLAGMPRIVAGPVVGGNGLAVETGSDGSAVIIDLNSGVTLGTIYPPKGTYAYSTGIAMPGTGTSLVTVTEGSVAGGPGELTYWQLSVAAWLNVACASAGHALTAAEWQEYVGGPPPAQLACAARAR